MVKLYCSEYCVRMFGWNWPKRRIGRKDDQSTGWPRTGLRMPLNGLGLTLPSWPTNGVLNMVFDRTVLPPKGARRCRVAAQTLGNRDGSYRRELRCHPETPDRAEIQSLRRFPGCNRWCQ